jgi:hypothetical protein
MVLGAATAAPAMRMLPGAEPDPLIARCADWLAIDLESDRLSRRWAALEARLVEECRWFSLSEAERRRLPEAAEMFEIEERLDRLSEELEQRLESLTRLKATDLHGAASKLVVAARVLRHDAGPTHGLVADAVQVLTTQRCTACGAPYLLGCSHA